MAKGEIPATDANAFALADQANIWLKLDDILAALGGSTPSKSVFKITGTLTNPQTLEFDYSAEIATFLSGTKLQVSFTNLRFATRIANPAPVNNFQNVSVLLDDGTNLRLIGNIPANIASVDNFININQNIKTNNSIFNGVLRFLNLTQNYTSVIELSGGVTSKKFIVSIQNAAQGEFVPIADPLVTQRELEIEIEIID